MLHAPASSPALISVYSFPRAHFETCRLLNLGGENVTLDSLNMFFLGLVKVQGGSSPLLPYYDNLYVDAAKAQRAAEHVFAQAPYIFRQKVIFAPPFATTAVSGELLDVYWRSSCK